MAVILEETSSFIPLSARAKSLRHGMQVEKTKFQNSLLLEDQCDHGLLV